MQKMIFGSTSRSTCPGKLFADVAYQTGSGFPTEPIPTAEAASLTVNIHFALGNFNYGNDLVGLLLYLKAL